MAPQPTSSPIVESTSSPQFWKSLFQLLNIKVNLLMAYHPKTDRQTKHVNQILEQYLCVYINYQQVDWVFKVSLETVVSEAAHQVTTELKELHQYLHNQNPHALKQYEVHSALRHLPIPLFQVGDTIWLVS